MKAPSFPSPSSIIMSKRRRLTLSSPPPSTPPPQFPPSLPSKQSPNGSKPKPETRRSLTPSLNEWRPLSVPRSELSLPLTLPTGQTFRWRRTSSPASEEVFTGVIGPHLLSLRHVDASPGGSVELLHHNPGPSPVESAVADYFNLGVDLEELWRGFASVDARFAELAGRFGGGARVLRQDPVECLFQFLCSSNNNIGRIEKMVGVISSFGRRLGRVAEFEFYEFPAIERLALVTEAELREAGFGYRAKYIVGTVKALQSKPGGGEEWLASLRGLELNEVIEALCTLPGVGPKVAACIALFSLDQHHAIPVDTHVWQIATRYLLPELAGMRLTPKLHCRVCDAFVSRFGKYAGWAQNVLFIGELPSQKALVAAADDTKSAKRKRVREKVTVQAVVQCR